LTVPAGGTIRCLSAYLHWRRLLLPKLKEIVQPFRGGKLFMLSDLNKL
jgi:hypothetical protein